ncbi:MAG TPA: hypothetical protein VEP49_09810 [Acidimicrobiia bacterium]|nr:hypothetical protein [Acidimicrobiia bacterium]
MIDRLDRRRVIATFLGFFVLLFAPIFFWAEQSPATHPRVRSCTGSPCLASSWAGARATRWTC